LRNITLKSEQKKVLYLDPNGAIQVKGGAGSGKTTVSVFRAKHLLDNHNQLFQEPNVIIFAYTKTLVEELKEITTQVYSGYNQGSDIISNKKYGMNVQISTFDSWVWHYFADYVERPSIISNSSRREIIEKLLDQPIFYQDKAIFNQEIEFYLNEIDFLQGKLINSLSEYLNARRIGRGTDVRVTQDNKKDLWEIYLHYKKELKNFNKIDFSGLRVLVLKHLKKNPFKNKFSHIVVDEAQDLPLVVFKIIKEIISDYTKSITIIGDSAQKIYSSGFTWSEIGINIVGRTVDLKENLRTTKKIHRASQHLIKNNDRYEESFPHKNQEEGLKPKIIYIDNIDIESQCVEAIKILNELNVQKSDKIVFAHRHNKGINEIFNILSSSDNGYSIQDIKPVDRYKTSHSYKSTKSDKKISLSTIHGIKGLTVDYVFLFDIIDGVIPYKERDSSLDMDRSLIYVAMTRPTKNFYLMTDKDEDNQSIFIKEISTSNDIEELMIFNNAQSDRYMVTEDDLPF
jgi:superfamily I DNA/RNA helicase